MTSAAHKLKQILEEKDWNLNEELVKLIVLNNGRNRAQNWDFDNYFN